MQILIKSEAFPRAWAMPSCQSGYRNAETGKAIERRWRIQTPTSSKRPIPDKVDEDDLVPGG
jgi:hypothetical protein